jgi:serine/threonine protein phosphatase PrpC
MPDFDGIELAGLSDIGCVRQDNEDALAQWQAADAEQFASKGRLAMVADGMGGYEGGQVASRMAVDTVTEIYSHSPGDPQALLTNGLIEAHSRILRYPDEHPGLRGMGTTCTAIAIIGKRLYYAHVGDSRLYRVHAGVITRITRDHSFVARLVESGAISADEAETHAQRHILTAALGAGESITPEEPEHPIWLTQGDVLVLCSDGLWGQVDDSEILAAVVGNVPAKACEILVKLARDRGAPDNATLQVLKLNR